MPQQDKFPVRIHAPDAAGVLLFEKATCLERFNEPYTFDLTVLSEKADLKADSLLGQPVALLLELATAGSDRPFHGLVSRFVQTGEQIFGGAQQKLYRYQLRLQPWFWFLTRSADCRIFQNKTVPQIFEAVVKEHGFQDYKLSLNGTYPAREYCVQYRESDFNFVGRLLEEVGIRYFFEHQQDRHVMVLADGADAHQTVSGYDKVILQPNTGGARLAGDVLETWVVEHSVQSGAFATTDFDFEKPTLSLAKSSVKSRSYAKSSFEVFDYPGTPEALTTTAMGNVASVRLEEMQAAYERFRGTSSRCRGLRTGAKFDLERHPNESLNRAYIIVGTSHTFASNQYTAGGDNTYSQSVAVEAIDSKTPYRPVRATPKPVIHGTQTAIVVGRANTEIDADKYGRVKVQFHWDRVGKKDENSSCWVRVAQVWAGKNWGTMHIPRVSQEVLVSFLEGDPDRPIITGRVYNGESMPPYALPDNRTQSGILSRSSPNGAAANANEIRFEDKKDSELLLVHAEKDLTTEVEHDESVSVGNDSKVEIKHDRTFTVKNDETCTVNGKRTAKVDKDESLTVGQNLTSDVKQNQTLDVGQKFKLKAGQEITLEVGAAKLVMKADGTIEVSGLDIKIDATSSIKQSGAAKIELSTMQYKLAGTVVQIQGTQTSIQGTLLDLQASAMASLKGALTQIG